MSGTRETGLQHLGGLALALVLMAGCWSLWLWVPGWVQGTPAQDLGLLITFLSWVALLTAGDWLWHGLAARLGGREH